MSLVWGHTWRQFQHGLEGEACGDGDGLGDGDAVEDFAVLERRKDPGQVARVDAVHGGAGADDGVEAEDGVLWVLGGEALDEVDLGANGEDAAGGGGFDGLDDKVGGAVGVGCVDDGHGALRVDDDVNTGVTLAGERDLFDGEALVDRAEAVPEEDAGVEKGSGGVAAEGQVRIPDGHLREGDAHGLGGVAAEVLVGEEEDALASFEGPLEDAGGVGGGADDSAALAAEAFEGGGGVHVGDWDDLLAAVGGELVAEDVGQLLPAVGDGVEVGHVGHGAAGGEVGEDDSLAGTGEHVGGFGHEVDAAEDDGFGVGTGEGSVGELEGVAEEVGVLDDLIALIEVAEDDELIAEGVFGGSDAEVELGGRGVAIFGGKPGLARSGRGKMVGHGGAGAVGRFSVEGPWRVGEGRAAGGELVRCSLLFVNLNQLDGAVYRGHNGLLELPPLASDGGRPGSIGCSCTSIGY